MTEIMWSSHYFRKNPRDIQNQKLASPEANNSNKQTEERMQNPQKLPPRQSSRYSTYLIDCAID